MIAVFNDGRNKRQWNGAIVISMHKASRTGGRIIQGALLCTLYVFLKTVGDAPAMFSWGGTRHFMGKFFYYISPETIFCIILGFNVTRLRFQCWTLFSNARAC